jgi:hypothetical protein
MHKWLKRMIIAGLLLAAAYVAGRAGLAYSIEGYRPYRGRLGSGYLRSLTQELASQPHSTQAAIANFALAKTCGALHFAWKRNAEQNPDRILAHRAAHCKMYAYVFASLHNQLCAQAGIPATVRVAYGQVYWYGLHLNALLPGRFFQNHDFCVVSDGRDSYAIDPVLFDYTFVRQVPLRR